MKQPWTRLAIGIACGAAIGFALDNVAAGIGIGLALAIALGWERPGGSK